MVNEMYLAESQACMGIGKRAWFLALMAFVFFPDGFSKPNYQTSLVAAASQGCDYQSIAEIEILIRQ